jgi:AraC-like DNA-binding protein
VKKIPYVNLDIVQLPSNDSVANLNDEFILLDNFSETNFDTKFVFAYYPVKLSFSIVICCLSGQMQFRVNLREFDLQANDVLIIQRGMIGELIARSNDCKVIVMAYTENYLQSIPHTDSLIALHGKLYDKPLYHMPREHMEECLLIFRQMMATIRCKDNPFRSGAVQGFMQALIYNACYLLMIDNVPSPQPNTRKQEFYERFMREVQLHYMEQRNIGYYADILCVTPKYLSQVIKQMSGRLAGDWIADHVILEAKALVKSEHYTIQQISEMLHFANQSFFSKYFKSKVGCSPTIYRQK